MPKVWVYFVIFSLVIRGCNYSNTDTYNKNEIVKVVDFRLSPDEDKIAFSAVTLIGNTDIWVIDIDGTNLRRLTFKDLSLSNRIASFFKKHKWKKFYRIDMCAPEWTKEGRISFCQRLTSHDTWGTHTVGLRYWTLKPDGTDKRPKRNKDEIVQRGLFDPINRFEASVQSGKHKKKVFLRDDGILWVLDHGETIPKRLIQ